MFLQLNGKPKKASTTAKVFMIISIVISFSIFSGENSHVALHGLGNIQTHKIKIENDPQTYHIITRLPENYQSTKKYPTIYLLDGGLSFPLLSSYYHLLRFTKDIPEMMIVGISYGTDDWRQGNSRSYDFTAKSAERAHWGGAEQFQLRLKNIIIPYIESSYASDPEKRLLFGNSLAGQFVLYSALTEPKLFFGYIASNPALHRNLPFFLQKYNRTYDTNTKSRLYVTSGKNDSPRFRQPALKWMKHWQSMAKKPWQLKTKTLKGEGHMSAIPKAFLTGTRWVLGKETQ